MQETLHRIIFEFDSQEEKENWYSIDDTVMGGISGSSFTVEGGKAIFTGKVSLENNGGFASVRTGSRPFDASGFGGIMLKVKGDGKLYSFRLKTDSQSDGVDYKCDFLTVNDNWMEIKLPFSEFIPTFRGRKLYNVPPLSKERISQMGILISDKQAGYFRLELEFIGLYKN